MKRIKKDEVYVVNQPKHAIMSLIFVEPKKKDRYEANFMCSNHDNVLRLAENTDVMFIFKNIDGIDPDVFSKVYGACAWIVSEKNLARTFIKAIAYSIIIFKRLSGFLTIDVADKLERLSIDQLNEIAGSAATRPIFAARQLDSDEMFEIYRKDDTPRPWWTWGQNSGPTREYTTWKMTTNAAFFRPSLFEKLDSLSDEYVDSFTWDHIRYFLASACEYLGVKRIDHNMFLLNVNRLSDYVDTEGKE